MNWLETLNDFNIISVIVRVFLAMLLGGCIGLEREKSKRPAGFRTHILVCVASCMTALIGLYVVYEMGANSDPVRIAAQVISGIGFLGVGTILVKEHDHITGLTTLQSQGRRYHPRNKSSPVCRAQNALSENRSDEP